MRKNKVVGFLYFSLYTQLWNEEQTWSCSRCPFLPSVLLLLGITNCSVFLWVRLHSGSKCFPQRIYSLAERATGDFGHKQASEEILNWWKEIFGICITKKKLIFFIKFMRLYSCVYMKHEKFQGPVAILPRKLQMIRTSREAGSVSGMCIRSGGMLLIPVELGWIRHWCNPVEIWPQSAREQKCLRCISPCRLTESFLCLKISLSCLCFPSTDVFWTGSLFQHEVGSSWPRSKCKNAFVWNCEVLETQWCLVM